MRVSVTWFRHGWGLAILTVALMILCVTVLTRLPEPVMAPASLMLFGLVQLAGAAARLARTGPARRERHTRQDEETA